MSIFTAAANDEDGDTISALREENEQLRQSLQAANYMLVKVSKAGAHHARAAECLRETVIRWAARAEQAEDMLEAIGAGGVGSKVARQDHHEQHLEMVPVGWKLVPVEPTDDMLYDIQEYSHILPPRGKRIWAHMLNAAPQPPVVEQPQVEAATGKDYLQVPAGFVLLQTENGKPVYSACLDGGRFHGWLMWKHPDGQWVSKRKLEAWEIMQAEDQRDYGIVQGD